MCQNRQSVSNICGWKISLVIRGLILAIFVLQLAVIGGQAHSQDLTDTEDWAGAAPLGFNLVFDGPVTVNWNDPNQIMRASLLATNLGTLAWELTGFRWGVIDAENRLHDVIGRGSYVNIEAEAHLGYELFPLDTSEIDVFWRTRTARNHASFVEQAIAMDAQSRSCFVQVRILISRTANAKSETWQAPIIKPCAF